MLNAAALSSGDKKILLSIARQSIRHGVKMGVPLQVDVDNYLSELQQKAATFVTLTKDGKLRGCMGSLKALDPLVENVSRNAFSAAFNDYRFNSVEVDEVENLKIEISLLTEPEEMHVISEEDLLSQLHPGEDGLIIKEGAHSATYLPSVWDVLPEKEDFVGELKLKAGLPRNYWSDSFHVSRYHAIKF